jgi:hypothetical protein
MGKTFTGVFLYASDGRIGIGVRDGAEDIFEGDGVVGVGINKSMLGFLVGEGEEFVDFAGDEGVLLKDELLKDISSKNITFGEGDGFEDLGFGFFGEEADENSHGEAPR